MSKYDFLTNESCGYRKERILQSIANELAEANRLKILELRERFKVSNGEAFTPYVIHDTELVDKA